MTTFTVWKFQDPDRAAHAESLLKTAEADGLVTIVDHAVMSRPDGASTPETHHHHDDPKRGAAWGALWGILGGALFAVPSPGRWWAPVWAPSRRPPPASASPRTTWSGSALRWCPGRRRCSSSPTTPTSPTRGAR